MNQDIKNEILEEVSLGNTKGALWLISEYIKERKSNKTFKKEIIILSNKYYRLSESKRLGIIHNSESEIEMSKINKALLELLEVIPTEEEEKSSPKIIIILRKYRLLIGAIFFILLLSILAISLLAWQEKKQYQAAYAKNSKLSYESFLKIYPNGIYKTVAHQKLDSIENAKAVSALNSKDISSLDNFLLEYPDGRFTKYMQSKRGDFNIKPIYKIDNGEQSNIYSGPNHIVFDHGRKIIFIEGSTIKILTIKSAEVVEISYKKANKDDKSRSNASGDLGSLSISPDEKYFGFYNANSNEVSIYTTSGDLKTVFKHNGVGVVLDLQISNNCNAIVISDESHEMYYVNPKNGVSKKIKMNVGDIDMSDACYAYYTLKNNLLILNDLDNYLKVCSFDGTVIFHSLSFYKSEDEWSEKPILTKEDKYLIVPIIKYGDDGNACQSKYFDSYNVFDLSRGEFLYAKSNEKFISLNQTETNNESFFCVSKNYVFERNLSNGNIIDTVLTFEEPNIGYIFKEIDIYNRLIAYSSIAHWDKIQIVDIKGKRLWGASISEDEKFPCAEHINFINKDCFITFDDDQIIIWRTDDILGE